MATSETSSKVSFNFTRKVESKLVLPTTSKVEIKQINVVQITEFSCTETPLPHGEPLFTNDLVIPMIHRNKWNPPPSATAPSAATIVVKQEILVPDDDNARAAAEILKDVEKLAGNQAKDNGDLGLEIPLWMQNRLPEGFETTGQLNVELRAEESTLEDYDKVPVDLYGIAMLRGMGWKPDEGIGKTHKRVTKPMEVNVRPRGLGLGATPIKDKNKGKSEANGEQKKQSKIVIGTFVQISEGRYVNRIGQVTGIDVELDRFIITLVGEEKRVVRILQSSLLHITEKEYQREARYINLDKFGDHKILQDEKLARIREEVHKEEETRKKHPREEENRGDRSRHRGTENDHDKSSNKDRTRRRSRDGEEKGSRSHQRRRSRSRSTEKKRSRRS